MAWGERGKTALALAVAGTALILAHFQVRSREPLPFLSGLKPGDKVPNFELPLAGGGSARLVDLTGARPALLLFWDASAPEAEEFARRLGGLLERAETPPVEALGILMTPTEEIAPEVAALPLRVALDVGGLIAFRCEIKAFPTVLLLNHQGVVVRSFSGALPELDTSFWEAVRSM